MIVILVVGATVIWMVYSWMVNGRPKNFPPGPPIIPWIGSIPFMAGAGDNFHFYMEDWLRTYGPVVGFQLGSQPTVAIVGGSAVVEALKHEDFQGRPHSEMIHERTFKDCLGVFFSDGPYWSEQRRFTLRHLKEFGFGMKSMEGMILEEAEDTLKVMKTYGNKPLQVSMFFTIPIINILWSTMAGKRHDRDDAEFQNILEVIYRNMRTGNPSGNTWYMMIPSLREWSAEWMQTLKNLDDVYDFVRKTVREHEKTLDPTSPRDFIDVYLQEMQKGVPGSTFHEKSLITICGDLFAAGGESVSNTLGFCLMYMVLYPEVQKAVQAELDKVVGGNRRVTLDDRHDLVYLEATVLEVMRCNTIAPLAVPHRVTKDTTFRGYDLPKDTMVFLSLWSCGQDEAHWGDVKNFRPERFIGKDGKLIKDEYAVTFGAGKRVCLGEALARNSLFIFFATIMQDLTFSLPPGAEKPSTICLTGFTAAPQPFEVIVTERT